ncbi:MAG: tetratricopeptide repeat protein [Azoarcus sp.]|nr:tetratricopeptide repeat protein [Azoarcus sp.]
MKPHAFVAMPFGTKAGHDAQPIAFNRVYSDYIEPALTAAGFDVFRADGGTHAGNIDPDMFQELLMADVVIVDLSLDNADVWYELGIRHALRAGGVILVQLARPDLPANTSAERRLNYHLKDGAPNPASLADDSQRLTDMARAILSAGHRRRTSPVYRLLPQLKAPEWKALLLGQRTTFGSAQEHWASRVEIAQQNACAGDLLLLAGEAPTIDLRIEGLLAAGKALLERHGYDFALEQFDTILGLDPDQDTARHRRIACLVHLGRLDEARAAARAITDHLPGNAEAWTLAGCIEKARWRSRWSSAGQSPTLLRQRASLEDAALAEAIAPYHKAFVIDPSHHGAGVNALALLLLRAHLGGAVDHELIEHLAGGVRWACVSALARNAEDHLAHASHARLSLLLDGPDEARRTYHRTVEAARHDWFALDAIRQTPLLLHELAFRPAQTAAALDIVNRELALCTPPFTPRRVFLFSGHMIDAPGRSTPRFPPDKEAAAAQQIAVCLDALGAGPGDLALTQGASGGDILFLEACAARSLRLHLMLPLDEPLFIEQSLLAASNGSEWHKRYLRLKAGLNDAPRILPVELGPLSWPDGTEPDNPFERCNRWLLWTALAWGIDKVQFICLWDGGGGDGPGGTAHMYREVKRRSGNVCWIDTRTL